MYYLPLIILLIIAMFIYNKKNTRENFLIEVKKMDSEYDSCYPGCGGKGVTGCIARGPYDNPCNGNERVCNSCIWCEWDSIRGKCVPAGTAIRNNPFPIYYTSPYSRYPYSWYNPYSWRFFN